MKKVFSALFILLFGVSNASIVPFRASDDFNFPIKKVPFLITKKRGVYIGYEKGLYDVLGFGMEFQRKKTGLNKINTNGLCAGFGYNLKYNILGYDISYWHKQGAFGLTYGAEAVFLTDFKRMNVGIAPVVGFRFAGFHLQTGYKFMSSKSNDVEANNFFVRLRFTIHKETDRDFHWKKK